jgi:Flp pilus assembly protein TadG
MQPRTRQSGASAVEFAFVFPILLAVFYSTVVYSYVFFLQQSINFAAQQGVQAAVAVVPTSNAATDTSNRQAQALAVVLSSLSWLPASQKTRVTEPAVTACPGATGAANTFSYEVSFTLTGLFPTMVNLPTNIGTIPPLPTSLIACAVAFD